MMSLAKAMRLAEASFPRGPEAIADKLGIVVQTAPLVGCDGWVLSGPAKTIIRINEKSSLNRQRFTLAHELGHLLLRVPTIVGESVYDSFHSNSSEEAQVNKLASELLLPESFVRLAFPEPPVIATQLKNFAKKANVSVLVVAIRVASVAVELGLINACITSFKNDAFEWNSSKTLKITPKLAAVLLAAAKACAPSPARVPHTNDKDVFVASQIENPWDNSATLFVQLLPKEVGNQSSSLERRCELESYLFENDEAFRMSLQGVFGAFKSKCNSKTVSQAYAEFVRTKREKYKGEQLKRLLSAKGREYIRLRLSEWCSQ